MWGDGVQGDGEFVWEWVWGGVLVSICLYIDLGLCGRVVSHIWAGTLHSSRFHSALAAIYPRWAALFGEYMEMSLHR